MGTTIAPIRSRTRALSRLDPTAWSVVGLTVLAAFLRFRTLGSQSFWLDESFTVGDAHASVGDLLHRLRHLETNPPLYFALEWVWVRVFGYSEVAVRATSAIAGVATVPVVYAATRTLVGRLAGVAAAALVAISPVLIYYSQEARPYALLVFLCTASLLFFARMLLLPAKRDAIGWVVASGCALCTHYFAAFMVIPMAAWLVLRSPARRMVLIAVGAVGAVGLALVPLIVLQLRESGGWVGKVPLGLRLAQAGRIFATGSYLPTRGLVPLVLAAALAALMLVLWRADPRTRTGSVTVLALAIASFLIPLAAAAVGADYLLDRYLLPIWVSLVIVVAAAVEVPRVARAGLIPALVLAGVFIGPAIARPPNVKHDDWRGMARVLGPAQPGRVVIVAPLPGLEIDPIRLYMTDLQPLDHSRSATKVAVIRYVAFSPSSRPVKAPRVPRAFRLVSSRPVQRWLVTQFRATQPRVVDPRRLITPFTTTGRYGTQVFVERPAKAPGSR